jgi:hypothetical protein
MPVRLFGYLLKAILIIVFFFSDKMILLPETFILWVWLIYIINVYLTFYNLGYARTATAITRIYLSRRPEETDRKVQRMYSTLIPSSMFAIGIIWSALRILSLLVILFYQGLVLGLCAEILLFLLIAILPVQYKSQLSNIHKQFGKPELKILKTREEAGFVTEDVKSIVEKAISDKIDPHKWWLEIKKKG